MISIFNYREREDLDIPARVPLLELLSWMRRGVLRAFSSAAEAIVPPEAFLPSAVVLDRVIHVVKSFKYDNNQSLTT